MAARVGLIAMREIGLEGFLAAFPMLEASMPSVGAGWVWASFNLFAQPELVGPSAEASLLGLGRPGLQAWTQDGALWHLAVYPTTRKLFRHVHWFRYNHVVTGREKVRQGLTLRRFLDQYEAGLPADYRYAGPLPEGPIVRALNEHLRARARALSDALAACGARHDRAAVRAALTGRSVSDQEWSWEVGNLPRLLDAIGLGEAFPGWREEIEVGRQAAGERRVVAAAAPEAPPLDLVQPLLDRLGAAEPAPIAGGPVVATPTTLWLLPWSCQPDVELGFLVRPAGAVTPRWPRGLEHLSVVDAGGEWRIGYPWRSVWQRGAAVQKLQAAFARLTDGSTLELVSAWVPETDREPAPGTAGNMRFRGVIERGRWKVSHAFPAVTGRDLKHALKIFAWIAGRGPFTTRSAAEASEVIELGRRSRQFGDQEKDLPVASGRGVTVRSRPWRHYLAMSLFRHRFAEGPWDLRPAQASERSAANDFDGMLEALGEQLNRAFAAPRGDETVFQGRRSAFRRADILQVRSRLDLAALFRRLYPLLDAGAAIDLPQAVSLVDQAMRNRGMVSLGDMVCEVFGEVVIRGYAREAGDVYGLTYAGTMDQFIYEFVTQFNDGSSLTTSIHEGTTRKELRMHHARFPNASVEELLDHHLAAVDKRTVGRVRPAPHPMELSALAERIDDFLVRAAS